MPTDTELPDMNVWFEQLEKLNQQVTQVFMSSLPAGSGDQTGEIYRSLLASQASSAATQLTRSRLGLPDGTGLTTQEV